MRLFIAEKPKMGQAIAESLGIIGRGDGFIKCKKDTVVTWCIGHMLEQAKPDDYDKRWKKWSRATLPIVPKKWKIFPKKTVEKQLNIIKNLMEKSELIVNAADPDREGQLIYGFLDHYLNNQKPVQRLWITSLDKKTIDEGLKNLTDNKQYDNLTTAALARGRADWLVGMNMTRALTLSAGNNQLISAGRVQTPTLALVVNRDIKIEQFVHHEYFVLTATFKHANGKFTALWLAQEFSAGLNEEGKLIDKQTVTDIIKRSSGQEGQIKENSRVKKQKQPPLPYNLSDLQKKCSDLFGFTAKETLTIAQSVYDKKALSYPRTDCRYLPEAQFSDAKAILRSLVGQGINGAAEADPKLKSAAWNTKKLNAEAHHGIIPTGQKTKLTGKERQLFDIVCKRYIKQFYPVFQYEAQKIIIELDGELWKATSQQELDPGWTVLNTAAKKSPHPLPKTRKNDKVSCLKVESEQKKTQPPSRFSEGSLIEAMANIHKFVSDPAIKKRLKESSGIGTQATRANIINELKNRSYLTAKGKTIISTALGREIVAKAPPTMTDPGTTALWEDDLEKIVENKAYYTNFMTNQIKSIVDMIDQAFKAKFFIPPPPTPVKAESKK